MWDGQPGIASATRILPHKCIFCQCQNGFISSWGLSPARLWELGKAAVAVTSWWLAGSQWIGLDRWDCWKDGTAGKCQLCVGFLPPLAAILCAGGRCSREMNASFILRWEYGTCFEHLQTRSRWNLYIAHQPLHSQFASPLPPLWCTFPVPSFALSFSQQVVNRKKASLSCVSENKGVGPYPRPVQTHVKRRFGRSYVKWILHLLMKNWRRSKNPWVLGIGWVERFLELQRNRTKFSQKMQMAVYCKRKVDL